MFLSAFICVILFCMLLSVFFPSAFANVYNLIRLIGLWKATVWLTILSCMNSSILALPILQAFNKSEATSSLAGSPLDKQWNSSTQRSVLNGLVKERIASMTFLTFVSLSTICDGRSSLCRDDSSDIYNILLDKKESNEALNFFINTSPFRGHNSLTTVT